MAERKRKTCLSISEKCLILQKIKNGESREEILNKYKISKRALRRIVQYADEVTNKSKDFECRNKKTMKFTEHAELEAALLKWFIQKRDSGQPISATMLQEKARIFNKMLKGPATFRASEGWVSGFKKRHELKSLSLKGETLSSEINSTKEFTKFLNEKIFRENLKLENIYNAYESGIYWKILLNYTFALFIEKSVAGFKDNKDRFTALFCANASGSHRIPLLIIGKSAKPTDLENLIPGIVKLHDINYLAELDITYSAQESGWMNCEIFKKWYEHEFIPRVLEHQKKTGNSGKVLLILDNAPSHSSARELNAINENFEVMFLPPNVTALIQPMNQSPILTTKKLYKRSLMRKLLIEKDYEKIETFLKELNLRDCLVMFSKGWSSVDQTTLRNAWKALLPEYMVIQKYENPIYDEVFLSCETDALVDETNLIYEFCEHLVKCLSKEDEESEEMSNKVKSKIEEWFNADEGDSGCEILSDEQIVQSVLNSQHNLDDLKSPSKVVDRTKIIHKKLQCKIDLKSPSKVADRTKIIHKKQQCKIDLKSPSKVVDQTNEKIAINEAQENFLKFKSWIMTHVQCSESQILHLRECENMLRNAIDNSQNECTEEIWIKCTLTSQLQPFCYFFYGPPRKWLISRL